MLSDLDIYTAARTGDFIVEPYDPAMVQPASIDLHLGCDFLKGTAGASEWVDPKEDQSNYWRKVHVPEGSALNLAAGEFALATTSEIVSLSPRLAGKFEGRSSIGRIGLLTHVTAGFIDPGFSGQITLELANVSGRPMRIYPGMRIGQLCLFRMDSPSLIPYGPGVGSHYQGQMGPQPSKIHTNFE